MSAYRQPLRRATDAFRRRMPLRFILIGCINTAFSYSLLVLLLFLGFSIELATLLALLLGIIFSFYTQGTFVFRYTSSSAFARFVAAWGAIYVVNVLIIRSFVALGTSSYLAAAIATAPITVASYFIQKRAVFRQSAKTVAAGRKVC